MTGFETQNILQAHAVINDTWNRLGNSANVKLYLGQPIDRLAGMSYDKAQQDAIFAQDTLTRIAALDMDTLPHDLSLTVQVAGFLMIYQAKAADWYWLAYSDEGSFPAPFQVSSYSFGPVLMGMQQILNSREFSSCGDADRYLGLLDDAACWFDDVTEKLIQQANRNIRIHQPAVPGTMAALKRQRALVLTFGKITPDRLQKLSDSDRFLKHVNRRMTDRILPAYDRIAAAITDDYISRAPEGVGMSALPGGADIYEELVRYHLTTNLTSREVHEMGLDRVARFESEMHEIRKNLGFSDIQTFQTHIRQDPKLTVNSTEDIQKTYEGCLARITPLVDKYFHFNTQKPCGFEQVAPELAAGMTFGYYHPASPVHPKGVYYFNSTNPADKPTLTAASLTYHELVPGHHFHLSTQNENPVLQPLRKFTYINAFNEAWAEYSATFAGELGLYETPYEKYGRTMMQSLLATRLVVDTGMNALGWSLEKARAYMAEHTAFSKAEIESESLRYSCDIPGQALAYKLGDERIFAMRQHMKDELGENFDIRDFHDAALKAGALPLDVLEWRVKVITVALKKGEKLQ